MKKKFQYKAKGQTEKISQTQDKQSNQPMQRKAIKLPDISGLTHDRATDETGNFVKSEMDKMKLHKALSQLHHFNTRSSEEVMEFVCYMFEQLAEANEQVCRPGERNRRFYFVASGQLLHRQIGGRQYSQVVEKRLLELDSWGLECLTTGLDERICVTATSPCRLYVLTARRFFWLVRMSAERTHRLQLAVVDSMLNARVSVVEQVLGLADSDMEFSSGTASLTVPVGNAESQPAIRLPDHSQKPQLKTKPPKSLLNATGAISRRVNLILLDALLHSIKQLDISAYRNAKDGPSVVISCGTGQAMVVYCLTGCARLILDHCNNVTSVVLENNLTLTAGKAHEIGANQNWKVASELMKNEKEYQQTIVYLIKLKISDKSSESTTD